MDFVDLDRLFAPIKKDANVTLEWGPYWGRKYGGWLNWQELLKRRRVALLAEALSGKTQELQHRAKVLQDQGKHAFFVRIEDIADDSFAGALNEVEVASFLQWKAEGQSDAWFFLDSVDEARLNSKHLANALNKFAKELQLANLGRAHVVVSCRASDWKGKADRDALENQLPYPKELDPTTASEDQDDALLAPIFDPTERTHHTPERPPEPHPAELLVVQLAPLTAEQKGRFAMAAGVTESRTFLEAVNASGLDAMAERPGDLIDLLGYWKEHSAFGTLAQMTEEGIKRKLREEDAYRSDAGTITFDRTREGAERLAAALVLGKTFTIKAPAQEADPTLAAGALDASELLPDWRQDEINALLRRGLFAPATYGRVRFHHRSSQEYLAACWLQRLLNGNCPFDEVKRLLFVEPYGVPTVRPALRALAAWLSLWQPSIRDEIVRREPVSLIAHGDPKSLPLEVREALLINYATLDSEGHISAEIIDYRAAWMFSNPALGNALRQAWHINQRGYFRLRALQFIEEGPIPSCADLAQSVALDESQSQSSRIVAARALSACGDTCGLEMLANQVRAAPDRFSAKLAPGLALILFPKNLSVSDLLDLISRSEPARPFQSEGFARHLAELHSRAQNREAQRQLAFGIADLCLAKPHVDEDAEISRRHVELSQGLAGLALAELGSRLDGDVEAGLLRLLMATERVRDADQSESMTQLRVRVRRDKALNRQLMWADAEVDSKGDPRETRPTRYWQIGPFTGGALWSVDISDIEWLAEDCRTKLEDHARQIAFSAIFHSLCQAGQLVDRHDMLEKLAASASVLQADLDAYQTPAIPDEYEAQRQVYRQKREEEQRQAKQSWIDFRDALQADPGVLDAPDALKSWKLGLFRLHDLTRWVKSRAHKAGLEGPRHWHFLNDAFGEAVTQHYAKAMRRVWRDIKPERPKYHGNGSYTTKHVSLLAVDSLVIDSATPDWEFRLTDQEVDTALRHGCFVGRSGDDWFDRIVRAWPSHALTVLGPSVGTEYKSEGARSDLLMQTAYNETAARAIVTKRVFDLLRTSEPIDDGTLEKVILIISRGLEHVPNKPLKHLVCSRLQDHLKSTCDKRAVAYYGLYARLDPDGMVDHVTALLIREPTEAKVEYVQRVQKWLGLLFADEGSSGAATGALSKMSVASLTRLVRLAYTQVPPQLDGSQSNDGTPGMRNAAESARRTLLNTLNARPGPEAFNALRELAADASFTESALRLNELAHGKAESDGDHVAWKALEVFAFERNHTAPVKTGADLLRIVLAVLSDIAASFDQADASSRGILALAQDENVVQNWLAEQINLRAKSRYHAHREPEVAQKNEPDIVVSSTAADVQVAIEVKNANMGWTTKEFEATLRGQLARDYLRAINRRHGILVISLHKPKTWRPGGAVWNFGGIISHLESVASTVHINETGPVEVRVVGIDATERLCAKKPAFRSR